MLERTDFSRFPEWMKNRGKVDKHFLGRQSAGADYVFYCPTEKRILTHEKFITKSCCLLPILHRDHPRGWSYDV